MNDQLRGESRNANDDALIVFLYYIKGDDVSRSFTLTPKEYYWKLTKKDIAEHYKESVERYSDCRDYIQEFDKDDIVLVVKTVKNFALRTIDQTTSFYFDDKSLVYQMTQDFDRRFIESSSIFARETDETYDVARIDLVENKMFVNRTFAKQGEVEEIAGFHKKIVFREKK